MTDGNQLGHAGGLLPREQRDRVGALGRRRPRGQGTAGGASPCIAAPGGALGHARVRDRPLMGSAGHPVGERVQGGHSHPFLLNVQ